jgi:histidinol-phosphate/aromatic aminotransferase/cobyric acid decarboxylase-like protein
MLLVPGFAEYRRALQQQGCEIIDYALSEQNGFQVDASHTGRRSRAQARLPVHRNAE